MSHDSSLLAHDGNVCHVAGLAVAPQSLGEVDLVVRDEHVYLIFNLEVRGYFT